MAADSLKFGTSGLRGLVADLKGAASRRYALAFIDYLKGRGEVVDGGFILVGRDLRDSSPAIGELSAPLALSRLVRTLPSSAMIVHFP